MKVELSVNNSVSPRMRYIGWAPSPCSIRLSDTTGATGPVTVQLLNKPPATGGRFVFRRTLTVTTATSLNLVLPLSGAPVTFFIQGGNTSKTVKQRIDALSRLPSALCEDRTKFNEVLAILRDTTQPAALRYAALQSIQAASFSAPNFEVCRPDYLATLRSLVADPDLELRQRVLGILAREHDGSTQRLLVDGLVEPNRALVPPEKALQLLSYDIHADAYSVARKIVTKPPSEAARMEALRLLAADSASASMFESMLRDKKEKVDARQVAAIALQTLAPEKLQGYARDIVQDESDDDDVKATSLTAITDFGKAGTVTDALYESVDKIRSKSKSGALKKTARRFIDKYRR